MIPNSSYGPPPLFLLLSRGCIHLAKLRPVDKYCKRDKAEGVQHKKSWYQEGEQKQEQKKDRWTAKQRTKTKAEEEKPSQEESLQNTDPVETCVLSGWLNQSGALEQIKVSYRCGLMDGFGGSLTLLPTHSIRRVSDHQEGKKWS